MHKFLIITIILATCQLNGLPDVLLMLSLSIWLLLLWVLTYNFTNTFPVSLRSGFCLILFGLVRIILDILVLFKFSSSLLAYRLSILPFLYNDFLLNPFGALFDYSRIDISYPYVLNSTLVHISQFLFPLAALFDYSLVMHKNVVSPYLMVLRSCSGTETTRCDSCSVGPADFHRCKYLLTVVVWFV